MIYTLTLNPALDLELTVPAFQFGEMIRATGARMDVGGKGINVSRMLASLGVGSVAMALAGDLSGERLVEGLTALGIETDFVRVRGETRTNVSIVAPDHGQQIKVNQAGPTITADEQTALRDRVLQRARRDDLWVLAGGLPPGIPPAFYGDLIRVLQAAGSRVILDTSGEALRQGCAARPFLIKPNRTEASELTGRPITTVEEAVAAGRLVERVPHVAISMGEAGAVLVQGNESWLITGPVVHQRNATGAGDALVGGLVYGLHEGRTVLDALRWGVACGAATASRPGTEVGTRDGVLALLREVLVQPTTSSDQRD